MQISVYQEGTKINTEVNERPLKNIGAHWNIRHHWFQRVPIFFSLANFCINKYYCYYYYTVLFVQVDKPLISGLLCILRRAVAMATPQPHKLPCLRWIDWIFRHQILTGDRPVSLRTTAGRTMDMFQAHTGMICYSSVIAICSYSAPSWRPVWSDMTSIDTQFAQCREDWSLASVLNHTIVTYPTIRQPGFDLPCHTWSLINRFQTGQCPCRANLHKWGLTQSPSCDCGQRRTMNHIVDTCPLRKFHSGLNLLHKADDDTVTWLESTATAALTK